MKYEVTRKMALEMAIAAIEGTPVPEEKKEETLATLKRLLATVTKSSSKGSGKSAEQLKMDEELKGKILEILDEKAGKRAGVVGIAVGISQSKATTLLGQLKTEGKVNNQKVKGVSLYTLA